VSAAEKRRATAPLSRPGVHLQRWRPRGAAITRSQSCARELRRASALPPTTTMTLVAAPPQRLEPLQGRRDALHLVSAGRQRKVGISGASCMQFFDLPQQRFRGRAPFAITPGLYLFASGDVG